MHFLVLFDKSAFGICIKNILKYILVSLHCSVVVYVLSTCLYIKSSNKPKLVVYSITADSYARCYLPACNNMHVTSATK